MKDEIEKVILEILYADFTLKIENLDTKEFKLKDEWGLDSLDTYCLQIGIEKKLDIIIKDELVEDWKDMTVDQISKQISANFF